MTRRSLFLSLPLLAQEKVDKAIDSAEKAGKKADAATDKFSAANKELEFLKKRVQGLDNKAK